MGQADEPRAVVVHPGACLAPAQGNDVGVADGSFKIQPANAAGNAHATGQAVFALREAGYDAEDSLVATGRAWLLEHQLADGSWDDNDWVGGTPSLVAPSMWAALALATFPSPVVGVRVAGEAITWPSVEGAETYDLVRGLLSDLAGAAFTVDLGPVECLAPSIGETSVQDSSVPGPGETFFYLLRIRWGNEHDSYGRSSDGRERLPLVGDCSP